MDNSDMPAMPQVITNSNDGSGLVGSHLEDEWSGLTKREMMSMHGDVDSIFENYFDNYKDMASFVGEEWASGSNDFQNISLEMKVRAKLKCVAADALLKELEK